MQNSDLIISLGCRLSKCHYGYLKEKFGMNAKKVHIDIDENEYNKNRDIIDLYIKCDIYYFLKNIVHMNKINKK